MEYLSVDDIAQLCRDTKVANYHELRVSALSDLMEKLRENIAVTGDEAKKEKLKACEQAIEILNSTGSTKALISPNDLRKMSDKIFAEYGLGAGTPEEKAQEVLDSKNNYKYFFSREELKSIFVSDVNSTNSSTGDVFPEKLLEELKKGIENNEDSFNVLNKKLDSRSFSSYENYSSSIADICTANLRHKQNFNEENKDHNIAIYIRDNILPCIKDFIMCSGKDEAWAAISYLLQYPALFKPMLNLYHGEIPEADTDRWIQSIMSLSGLNNRNEAKKIILALAPYFDITISEEKFKYENEKQKYGGGGNPHNQHSSDDYFGNTHRADPRNDYFGDTYRSDSRDDYYRNPYRSDPRDDYYRNPYKPNPEYDYDGYPHRSYHQMDPIFIRRFDRCIESLTSCINSSERIPYEKFVAAHKELLDLYDKYPDEIAREKKNIPDYEAAFEKMCMLVNEFIKQYTQASDLNKQTNDALDEMNAIFYGKIKPTGSQKKLLREKYIKLEEKLKEFYGKEVVWGENSDRPSGYQVLKSLEETITNKYSETGTDTCLYDVTNNMLPKAKAFFMRKKTAFRTKIMGRIKPLIVTIVALIAIPPLFNIWAKMYKDTSLEGTQETGEIVSSSEEEKNNNTYESQEGDNKEQEKSGVVNMLELEAASSDNIETDLTEGYEVGGEYWSHAILFKPWGSWAGFLNSSVQYNLFDKYTVLQFRIAPYITGSNFSNGESTQMRLIDLDSSKILYENVITRDFEPTELSFDVSGVKTLKFEFVPLPGEPDEAGGVREAKPYVIIDSPTLYEHGTEPDGLETNNTEYE